MYFLGGEIRAGAGGDRYNVRSREVVLGRKALPDWSTEDEDGGDDDQRRQTPGKPAAAKAAAKAVAKAVEESEGRRQKEAAKARRANYKIAEKAEF